MRDLFIASKNTDLINNILLLLNQVIPHENWNLMPKFSNKADLVIFDTESEEFSDFQKYHSDSPTLLFSYKLRPLLLQYTTKFYISGIISFEMKYEDIARTIDAVFSNNIFYSDAMISLLFSNKINDQAKCIASLTERENEILVMMMKDMTNEDIATELDVSVRTINAHKGNIMRKVGSKTTSGLIKAALDYSAILKTQL